MKKLKAIKIVDTDEVYLLTENGGYVPSLGGFTTYDDGWFLPDWTIEDIEVDHNIFDELPMIELESSGIVADDDFIYV